MKARLTKKPVLKKSRTTKGKRPGNEPALDLDARQMTSRVVHQAPGVLEVEFTSGKI